MLYRYWLRSMPLVVNRSAATCACTEEEKLVRSLTHQAPEAPKPATVCAGAVMTAAVEAASAEPGSTAAVPAVAASSIAPVSNGGSTLFPRRVRVRTIGYPLIRA